MPFSLTLDSPFHIKIHLELSGNLQEVVGDPEKWRQVIVNLINNANHAMKPLGKGRLCLSTSYETTTDKVWVDVRDEGHGIPDHVMARIFDPFFTTKPVGKGTGLGLSVSYAIIREHGGTIEVESPARGPQAALLPGTLFRLAACRPGNNSGHRVNPHFQPAVRRKQWLKS